MDIRPRETALRYIRYFAAGDLDGLASVLAERLKFAGPHLSVDSKAAYLDALRGDLPEKCDVAISTVTEEEDEVVVFYELLKPTGALMVAQWFRCNAEGIQETRLVF